MEVNISLAAYPGFRHVEAAITAISAANAGTLVEPLFGAIQAKHVQLVPQNFGVLDVEMVDQLRSGFPDTQFRLHANVRVLTKHIIADLSNFADHPAWWAKAATLSQHMKAPAYSAHSGRRSEANMSQMLDNARKAAELFQCPVAIEGQYPTKEGDLLVASWDEYREVLESGLPFALDLSHLNILAHRSKKKEMGLVREMLNSEQCLEVHVSDNDGSGDWHQVCESTTWWQELLPHIHEDAVIFTEGNHRFNRKKHVH